MKAILSIKPKFVEEILSGNKKFEYRKKIFKQDIDSVVIYASRPIGMFVGEFKIKNTLYDDIDTIWEKTNNFSGISHKYFKKYFEKHDKGYALEIDDLIIYEEPIIPQKILSNFKAPQSFCYIKEDFSPVEAK